MAIASATNNNCKFLYHVGFIVCLFVDYYHYCRITCTVLQWYAYFTCTALYEMCVSYNLQFVVMVMVINILDVAVMNII